MRIFVFTLALVIILCGYAASDVIYFKDGGRITGIVTEEADGRVVIDIGIGTMTVGKDEIDYIKEATPEDLERLRREKLNHEIERGEWAPDGYENVRIRYCRAKDNKATLQEAKKKSAA